MQGGRRTGTILAVAKVVVLVARLCGEDEQRRSREQSNYQLPLGNHHYFALRTRPGYASSSPSE